MPSTMNIKLPKVGDERPGYFKTFRYPAGEIQTRISDVKYLKNIQDASRVVLNMEYTSGDDLIILAQVLDIIVRTAPHFKKKDDLISIELFVPYLPFGRADRPFVEGDCIGLNVFVTQLVGVCNRFNVKKIITLDNHNREASYLIRREVSLTNGSLAVQELFAEPYIMAAIKNTLDLWGCNHRGIGERTINVLFPDEGAAFRYSIPNEIFGSVGTIKINKLFAKKKRNAETGEFLGFEVPDSIEFVSDAPILIVDDICDGGGTFNGVFDELVKNGSLLGPDKDTRVSLFVTHGIFSKGFNELEKRFFRIYTTSSIIFAHHEEESFEKISRYIVEVFQIVYS